MHTRQVVYCPYCKEPLPDDTELRKEVIQAMPEEANRDYTRTCKCGAYIRITPDGQATIRRKPLPHRDKPGYAALLSQGKSPSEVAAIIATYPDAKNKKGELINK